MPEKHGLFGISEHRLGGMAGKITRDAFLYLPAKGDKQCKSCSLLTKDKICVPLDQKVEDGWTCGLYIPGPYTGGKPAKQVTAEDAGLTKTQVRCENCTYGGEHCGLFKMLNQKLPKVFSLDTKIESKGCCNGWVEK